MVTNILDWNKQDSKSQAIQIKTASQAFQNCINSIGILRPANYPGQIKDLWKGSRHRGIPMQNNFCPSSHQPALTKNQTDHTDPQWHLYDIQTLKPEADWWLGHNYCKLDKRHQKEWVECGNWLWLVLCCFKQVLLGERQVQEKRRNGRWEEKVT